MASTLGVLTRTLGAVVNHKYVVVMMLELTLELCSEASFSQTNGGKEYQLLPQTTLLKSSLLQQYKLNYLHDYILIILVYRLHKVTQVFETSVFLLNIIY